MADRQSAASIDTALRVGEGCTATSMLAHPGASGVTLVICSTDHGVGLDWPALAHSEGSLVICMGRGRLLNVVARLIAAGMPPDTPAAVVALGAPAGHGHVVSTLGVLPTRAAARGLAAPAIVVVGASAARVRCDTGAGRSTHGGSAAYIAGGARTNYPRQQE